MATGVLETSKARVWAPLIGYSLLGTQTSCCAVAARLFCCWTRPVVYCWAAIMVEGVRTWGCVWEKVPAADW